MPFTSAMLLIGALALAAFPLTSGLFSKDEILDFAADRGGFYVIFTVGGYIGALLTAFYAFRIVFRVVFGEPCEEAQELEQGHLHHAEPENPATGEHEDTDVGFPGPSHHIAERDVADEDRDERPRRSARCSPAWSRSRASTTWSTTSCPALSPTRAATSSDRAHDRPPTAACDRRR